MVCPGTRRLFHFPFALRNKRCAVVTSKQDLLWAACRKKTGKLLVSYVIKPYKLQPKPTVRQGRGFVITFKRTKTLVGGQTTMIADMRPPRRICTPYRGLLGPPGALLGS